jgi:hypothetical protein
MAPTISAAKRPEVRLQILAVRRTLISVIPDIIQEDASK